MLETDMCGISIEWVIHYEIFLLGEINRKIIFFLLKPGWPPLKTGSTCTEIPCELEIRSMGHLYFELVSRLSYPSVSITKFKRVNGLAPGPSNACLAPSLCSPSKKARRMFAGPLVTSEKVSEETLLHNSNAALTACLT